jgi:hypothetical protein
MIINILAMTIDIWTFETPNFDFTPRETTRRNNPNSALTH